jgi:hypothetical protein
MSIATIVIMLSRLRLHVGSRPRNSRLPPWK